LCGIDADQQQIVFAGKMPGGGFLDLGCRGKMYEVVPSIDVGPEKHTGAFRFPPQFDGANLVESPHDACRLCSWTSNYYWPITFRAWVHSENELELLQPLCISPVKIHYGDIMPKTEEFLIETADRCTGLAREGRELIERLEALRNDLMAKAVELDTRRQRAEKSTDDFDKV